MREKGNNRKERERERKRSRVTLQNTKHLSRDRFTISTTWRQTIHYCGCTPVSACIHECTHTEHFIRASGIHFSSVNVTTIPRIEWRPLSLLIILSTTCIMFPRVTSCVTIVYEFTYLWFFFFSFRFVSILVSSSIQVTS